jgi:hypothetical protein
LLAAGTSAVFVSENARPESQKKERRRRKLKRTWSIYAHTNTPIALAER